ncbi:MAG TPA: plastocyanin/azurin family copper-binding protein [Gaiellaceae bacterium]|nr:plastocyanin/azurin family copper-binding protein [Gaiellaceae bacterium]
MIAAPVHHVRPPARVQVVASEFRLTLSRGAVRAGTAIVELVNMGEDTHDLKVRRAGGGPTTSWRIVRPGEHVDRRLTLRPGRYVLWCSLPGHRALGMQAVLVVRR